MATGIVVRVIADHIRHKTKDPAVVVVDDAGQFAISLLSGHLGGANELAGLTAFMIKADALLLLSNIDGFYTGNPTESTSELIPVVNYGDYGIEKYIQSVKSSGGRGGMESKFNTAKKVSEKGIITYIAHGKKTNIILDIVHEKEIGTKFLPKNN